MKQEFPFALIGAILHPQHEIPSAMSMAVVLVAVIGGGAFFQKGVVLRLLQGYEAPKFF